jgi:signal transduction histidine kinase
MAETEGGSGYIVKTFIASIHLAVADPNQWPGFLAEFFKAHRASVFMLSVVVAALFSFLMWIASRHIKSEKWMKYFAWSFGLLSVQYLLLLINWFRHFHPDTNGVRPPEAAIGALILLVLVQLLSMINNLCAVAAAQNMENKTRLVPLAAWILAGGSLLTTLAAPFFEKNLLSILFIRSVTSIFSAYCLFKVGFAIFANISIRRHRRMALGAIIVASIYALLQLAYWGSPLLADTFIAGDEFMKRLDSFDMLLLGIALPLKFLLCGFAYLVVMRFFETLNEVRRLQTGDNEQRQDYLSTKGIARLIGGKLGDQEQDAALDAPVRGATQGKGFVNIIVKLPGVVNKRIACIPWPNEEPEQQRALIFDWPEPMSFSRRIVIDNPDPQKIEPEHGQTVPYEWEKALALTGKVMMEEERKEILWLRDDPKTHIDDNLYKGDMKTIASVAIVSHGAVIGCLQVARSQYRFSQMALRQISEIANLLSPAIQAYRELASLDQMSIRFAWKQAEENPYSPVASTKVIAEIIHDVFAPHITRIHMDFGFSSEEPHYIPDEHKGQLLEDMKAQCDGKDWQQIDTELYSGSDQYRLLKKRLTARVTETLSTDEVHQDIRDQFITGDLILAINEKDDSYGRAALGVTYLQRKAAATIAADAHLDFARDYHNDLLKGLSKELSQKRLNIQEWFEPIYRVLKEAGLSWVVVSQRKKGGKMGDDEGKYILQNFNQLAAKENPLPPMGAIKITHHPLKAKYKNTSHVLRVDLQDSNCYVWLGVERQGFGPELGFTSPWRTFLVNFAQIADAALTRITFPEKFQLHLEAAQLQGIMATYVTTGTVIHQLSNMIQGQTITIGNLLDAVALKKLVADEKIVRRIHTMQEAAQDMQELFRSFDRITKIDKDRPCQLRDAVLHAFKLFRVSLDHRQIKYEMQVSENITIDVPLNVAALALANLVGNAKDAVSVGGEIKIEAEMNGEFALCRVRDNGNGMPNELRKIIFEPKDSPREAGSGLGLYLTYHSLMENRSNIELTETGPTGTVFTVKFPLAKEKISV